MPAAGAELSSEERVNPSLRCPRVPQGMLQDMALVGFCPCSSSRAQLAVRTG